MLTFGASVENESTDTVDASIDFALMCSSQRFSENLSGRLGSQLIDWSFNVFFFFFLCECQVSSTLYHHSLCIKIYSSDCRFLFKA